MRKRKREHKMEIRKREINESYCVQPGCKFKGKPAAQGICHTVLDKDRDKYIRTVLQEGQDFLDDIKSLRKVNKQTTAKAWIRYLEGHVACQWANTQFTLDELIYLRAENARLKLAAGKWRRR
jgi:hypothetical protein